MNDKTNIILEIGKQYTKCGFAGEPSPRAIIKSKEDKYIHDINDPQELHSCLASFFEKIFFNYLAVSPRARKVVIVESIFTKSLIRNVLTKLFLETFEASAILFVPDHLMALTTLGIPSGLVVDLGSSEAIAIAVLDGITLLDCSRFACLGSKVLDSLIYKELVSVNPNEKDLIDEKCVEDIRVRSCFVAPFERSRKIANKKLAKSKEIQRKLLDPNKQLSELSNTVKDCYFIDDEDEDSPIHINYLVNNKKYIKVPGNIREGACEMLFEMYGHEHSLTTLIVDAIASAPVDYRKTLSENIFLVGGLANLPGLQHRLSEELLNINEYNVCSHKVCTDNFALHKSICPLNYVSWLGASIFCTPSSIDVRATTRDQWIKEGKQNPRDWSDLAMIDN